MRNNKYYSVAPSSNETKRDISARLLADMERYLSGGGEVKRVPMGYQVLAQPNLRRYGR